MSADILDIRPGVRDSEYLAPLDLTDPDGELEALRQVRCLAIGVFTRCSGMTSDNDVAACVNIASTIATITRSIAAARMARTASQKALALHLACQSALEQAETL